MKARGSKSWMAQHIKDAHGGIYTVANPGADWPAGIGGQHRKPLNRQVSEYVKIREAKTTGMAIIGGRETAISRELFNSKEEWYSHTSQWDTVG